MLLPDILKLQNMGGEFFQLKQAIDDKKSTIVTSAMQNSRYHLVSSLDRFFLYITTDRVAANDACDNFRNYFSESEIVLIPERDDVLSRVKSYLSGSINERMLAVSDIIYKKDIKGAVITVDGLVQYLPHIDKFKEASTLFKIGEEFDRDTLTIKLIDAGYLLEDKSPQEGSFVIRGDIIDIWPVGYINPIRMSFFGDFLETIRILDTTLETSGERIDQFCVSPKTDFILDSTAKSNIKKLLKEMKLNAGAHLAEIIENIIKTIETEDYTNSALVWLLPFLKEYFSTIADYLPESTVIVFEDPKAADDKINMHAIAHKLRVDSLVEMFEAFPEHYESIIDKDIIFRELSKFRTLAFAYGEPNNPVFEPELVLDIKAPSVSKFDRNYIVLINEVKSMIINGFNVYIYTGSQDSANLVARYFADADLASLVTSNPNDIAEIHILPMRINSGFIYPNKKIAIIGTNDIVRHQISKKKSDAEKRRAFVIPTKGDYVVHEQHGIGLAAGITVVETNNLKRDYFVIEYAAGDKLYLPTDQMDSVEKYTGMGTPVLNRLGSTQFARAKERVKKAIKPFALDLVALYDERGSKRGFKYSSDTPLQSEMENAFEFQETEDQLTAIAEIKFDMESGRIMDRLLCGDVGFGKTEVAIRAMFKTTMDMKQAVILAPTTVLCAQHFKTIKARLEPFGSVVVSLSRFESEAGTKQALEDIESGKADIIVGTHRILSKDVKFNDLGLLVIDEEQRFGVAAKERIKELRRDINVLTMTATPIPRTLHMSLSGIRDISTLETAPKNRLPIETYSVQYSDQLVQYAIKKEKARGGQAFILYNRVQSIQRYTNHIQKLLGDEISVICAHGQMNVHQLEKTIDDFYNKKADVLVATTIIENGIDVPDANTLIIVDADTLGLSDMYQIRGRVGRSCNLAYAYFTVRPGKVLTHDAEKRLNAIINHTELGSGFKIAVEDMEIRGVGNVLGREQHGNMENVGYDMYCQLLKECITEATGGMVKNDINVEMIVDGNIAVPTDYIYDDVQRIKFYKNAATISTIDEKNNLLDRLKDLYGPPPVSVQNIISVCTIKNIAAKLDIRKVVITDRESKAYFEFNSTKRDKKLFNNIIESRGMVKFVPGNVAHLVFNFNAYTPESHIKAVEEFFLKAN
ncbi:MAG: transcription-repair coupling factor [Christensenellaceae bacterium]|jgi:transcription-repair coupling factor (superfamily II helicase)|nr:transcription-repair coupling factor [Christensenellaceae bacterium]